MSFECKVIYFVLKHLPGGVFKKSALKSSVKFTGKHMYWCLFLNKESFFLGVVFKKLYQKETPAQVFSCECCKMFEGTYFAEHLCVTASVQNWYAMYI